MVHAIAHILGLDNASGPWYLWWSGACADLGMIGAAYTLIRRHNCEVHHCWRIGRHATAAGHRVCARHHPEDQITAAVVASAHEQASQ